MLIGYARVSTNDQSFDLQLDALAKAGCERVFRDVGSGAAAERHGLAEALGYARKGDTLVVWKLDRLGRSLSRLMALTKTLEERRIGFKSLVDVIDTTTSMGRFFFHVTAALAELERDLIRERTDAGLAAARARGHRGGRPKALDAEGVAMALDLYRANKASVGAISRRLGVAKRTLYRYLAEEAAPMADGSVPTSR